MDDPSWFFMVQLEFKPIYDIIFNPEYKFLAGINISSLLQVAAHHKRIPWTGL